jgi:hypothetical protein
MSKTIPLTRGKHAIVDDADFAALSAFRWAALLSSGKFYAVRNVPRENGKGQTLVYMHRQLLGVGAHVKTSFLNGDSLDNRRENICVRGATSTPVAVAGVAALMRPAERAEHPGSAQAGKRLILPSHIVPMQDGKSPALFYDLARKLYLVWDRNVGKRGAWRTGKTLERARRPLGAVAELL